MINHPTSPTEVCCQYSALSISRGDFSPTNLEKQYSHSSPLGAKDGIIFFKLKFRHLNYFRLSPTVVMSLDLNIPTDKIHLYNKCGKRQNPKILAQTISRYICRYALHNDNFITDERAIVIQTVPRSVEPPVMLIDEAFEPSQSEILKLKLQNAFRLAYMYV